VNKDKLAELIEFVKTTDLQEVVWEKKGSSIRFRLSPDSVSAQEVTPALSTAVPAGAGAAASTEPEKIVIKSLMVGTFYRADSKDRPPLVVEGTLVTAGQPVGSVEAMKIMKDVVAPIDCKIIKALVANGHAVEYGQALFEVEPVPGDSHV